MSRSLKLFITGLVSLSLVALALTSFVYAGIPGLVGGIRPEIALDVGQPIEIEVLLGLMFWIGLTLFAGALPVRMQHGTFISRRDGDHCRGDGARRCRRRWLGGADRNN